MCGASVSAEDFRLQAGSGPGAESHPSRSAKAPSPPPPLPSARTPTARLKRGRSDAEDQVLGERHFNNISAIRAVHAHTAGCLLSREVRTAGRKLVAPHASSIIPSFLRSPFFHSSSVVFSFPRDQTKGAVCETLKIDRQYAVYRYRAR